MNAPLSFAPVYQHRVWGGRGFEQTYGRVLPDGEVGEAWELVDRPEAQSVVVGGPLDGHRLADLWRDRRTLFGARAAGLEGPFPLLVKLLDARATLSVQVHPPAHLAPGLGGEPKTEMWFVAQAQPGAYVLAGLRRGVTQATFADAQRAGDDLSQLLHRHEVSAGDALLVPSGRVHALGAGCLVVEVQQNSDTTYRVYDWDRPGPDGNPRELHVEQCLACIDWADVEPDLLPRTTGPVVRDPRFGVSRLAVGREQRVCPEGECAFVFVLSGTATCGGAAFAAGDFFLVPAGGEPVGGPAEVLVTELPDPA